MSGLRERLDEFARNYQAALSGSARTRAAARDTRVMRDAIVVDFDPPAEGWEEGSPEDDGPYWVRWAAGQFERVYYADRVGGLWFIAGATVESTGITHYRPLTIPAPPGGAS